MQKKTKLLLATGIFPPDIGGPATYTSTLRKDLDEYGFEVKVAAYSDKKADDQTGVYTVSRKHNIFLRYFLFFWQVFKLAGWADIIYIQDLISEGIPGRLACRLRRKPYILKIVGDYAWEQARQRYEVEDHLDDFQDKAYSRPVERLRRLQRKTARDAACIIVPSRYLAGIVAKWGVDKEKITVIHNGISRPQVDLDQGLARKELGLSGDIILSAGRLVPWKGFGTLIEIMPKLLEGNPDFKLYIAGDGPLRDELASRISDLGIEKSVFLTGPLPQKELHKYMSASRMFVLNTAYEGLPHIVIEAIHFKLPVIATNIGGNPEVVKHGRTGLLVEYDNKEEIKNAILDFYNNPDKAAQMAENAYGKLGKFSRETMVKNTAEFLKNFYDKEY